MKDCIYVGKWCTTRPWSWSCPCPCNAWQAAWQSSIAVLRTMACMFLILLFMMRVKWI